MASIVRRVPLRVSPHHAWSVLREVGDAHQLFRGVLSDCRRDWDERVATFADGTVVHELIVSLDDASRRFAYAVQGRFRHHSASMQILPHPVGCEFVWITDVLPDEAVLRVEGLMNAGLAAARSTLEDQAGSSASRH